MPGCWVDELPFVLWSINTTPNISTGYTLFFMVYGAEAVLPSDIRHDSPRVAAYVETDNEHARQDALDLLDEQRDVAAARSAIYQQDLHRYHSRRVKSRVFQEGDLVLRLIQDQTDMHKLSPLSDYGFRKPLRGSNSRVRTKIFSLPKCAHNLPAILS